MEPQKKSPLPIIAIIVVALILIGGGIALTSRGGSIVSPVPQEGDVRVIFENPTPSESSSSLPEASLDATPSSSSKATPKATPKNSPSPTPKASSEEET